MLAKAMQLADSPHGHVRTHSPDARWGPLSSASDLALCYGPRCFHTASIRSAVALSPIARCPFGGDPEVPQ
eukprot:15081696-Alexandrium_andersonii.AAC.1